MKQGNNASYVPGIAAQTKRNVRAFAMLPVIIIALLFVLPSVSHAAGPSLTVSITSPLATNTIDVGQSISVSATATGGIPPYTYSWSQSGSCPGFNTAIGNVNQFTYSPTSTTSNCEFTVTVTDSTNANIISATTPKIIANQALGLTFDLSNSIIDPGQSVTFELTASGGTPNYIFGLSNTNSCYSYLSLSQSSTSFLYTVSPTCGGPITGSVIDNTVGTGNDVSVTNTLTIESTPDVSLSVSNAIIDSGQSTTLTASATGGTGSFTYAFYNTLSNAQLCITSSSDSCTISPTATSYVSQSYNVVVTDTGTTTPFVFSSADINVQEFPALSVSVTNSISTLDQGQQITFVATGSGGSGNANYIYSWSLPSGVTPTAGSCGTGNTDTVCTVTATGLGSPAEDITVTLTDKGPTNAQTTNAVASLTVNTDPTLTLTPTGATPVDAGQNVIFTVDVTGGTGHFNIGLYNQSGTDFQKGVSNALVISPGGSNIISFIPNVGESNFNAIGTDLGTTVPYIFNSAGTTSLTVNQQPSLTISPSNTLLDTSQVETYNNMISGGVGPFFVALYNAISEIQVGSNIILHNNNYQSSGPISFIANVAGTFEFNSVATDNGVTPNYVFNSTKNTIFVKTAPTLLISPSNTVLDQGQTETYTFTINNGFSPFEVELYNITNAPYSQQGSNTVVHSPGGTGTVSFVVGKTGTFTYNGIGTDQGTTTPYVFSSISNTIIVNTALNQPTLTTNGVAFDVAQPITLSSTLGSGGTSPYTYNFIVTNTLHNNVVLSSGPLTSNKFTFLSRASMLGGYTATVTVEDSASTNSFSTSEPKSFSVATTPSLTITPTNSILDSGQYETYSVAVNGGFGPFTVELYNVTGHKNQDSNVIVTVPGGTSYTTFQTSTTGTFTYNAIATDQGTTTPYVFSSIRNTIIVNTALNQPTLTTNGVAFDVAQPITLSSTLGSGGTSPYTYNFIVTNTLHNNVVLSSGPLTSNKFTFLSSASMLGGYTATVTVEDSASTNSFSTSEPKSFSVATTPSLTITPTNSILDSGQYETYSVAVNGGFGPFTVELYNVTGSKQQDSNVIVTVPGGTSDTTFQTSTTGTFTYNAIATDQGTTTPYVFSSIRNTIIVKTQLHSTLINTNGTVFDIGQSVAVSSTPETYGTSPYTYNFLISNSTNHNVVYYISTKSYTGGFVAASTLGAGGFNANVLVSDSATTPETVVSSDTMSFVIKPMPEVTLYISNSIADSGQYETLTASATGGTGVRNFTYAFYNVTSGSPVAVPGCSGTSDTCTFPSGKTGVFTYNVVITDHGTTTPYLFTSLSNSLTVNSDPILTITPSSNPVDSGETEIYTLSINGGTSKFTALLYNVTGGKQQGSNVIVYTTPGSNTVSFVVDSPQASAIQFNGTATDLGTTTPYVFSSAGRSDLEVYTVPTLTLIPSNTLLESGQTETYTISTTNSNGIGPFNIELYNITGSKQQDSNITLTRGSSGTISFQTGSIGSFQYNAIATDQGTIPPYMFSSLPNTIVVFTIPTAVLTPSSPVMDSGQSITLNAVVTGGSGTFTYKWYSGTPGSGTLLSGSANGIVVKPTSTTTYFAEITDTGVTTPYTFNSAPDTVTVDTSPTVSTPPTSGTMDVGQSDTLSSTVTGGTGSYSWQWYDNGLPITGATGTGASAAHTFTPSVAATNKIYAVFVDTGTSPYASPPANVQSSNAVITVYPTPTATELTPSNTVLDQGQYVTYNVLISGGSNTNMLLDLYYRPENGVAQSITGAGDGVQTFVSFQPPVNGGSLYGNPDDNTYYVSASDHGTTVTPYSYFFSNPLDNSITVNPALTTPTISPIPATIDSGDSLILSSSWTGGSPTYNAVLYSSATPTCSSSSTYVSNKAGLTSGSVSFTVSPTSNTYYCIYVTDSATTPVTVNSATDEVTVNPTPIVTSINAPASATMDIGQSDTLTSKVTGGSGSFSWQWYDNGLAINGASGTGVTASNTFTPSVVATNNIYVIFTDTGTNSIAQATAQSANAVITVYAKPSVTLSPSPATIDHGQSIPLTATPSGGTGSFSYQWTVNSIDVGTNSNTYTFSGTALGTSTVNVIITDIGTTTPPAEPSVTANAVDAITVDSVPTVTSANAPLSATMDIGQSDTLSSTVTGGTGSFSYQWYLNGASITGASGTGTTATYEFTPASASTDNVYVIFTDTGTNTLATPTTTAQSANAVMTVYDAPTVVVMPLLNNIDSGQSVTLTADTALGTGSFTYQWYTGLPNGANSIITGATNPTYQATPSSSTEYFVVVNDIGTSTPPAEPIISVASSPDLVEVNQDPHLTISPSNSVLDSGEYETYTASVTGGIGPFTIELYNVTGSSQQGSNVIITTPPGSNTITFRTGATGTFTYNAIATDTGSTAGPYVFNSTKNTITVNSDLTVPTVTISGSAFDEGETVQLSALGVSGGTPPYTYTFEVTNSNTLATLFTCKNAIIAGCSFTATQLGNYYANVIVTDSASTPTNAVSTSPASFTVFNNFEQNSRAAATINRTTMDIGNTILLTGNVIGLGGTPPYTYEFNVVNDINGATVYTASVTNALLGNSITYTPTANGIYYTYVTIFDSATPNEYLTSGPSEAFSVGPVLTPTAILTPGSTVLDGGQTEIFGVQVFDGIGPFTVELYNVTGSKQQGSNVIITPPTDSNSISFVTGTTTSVSLEYNAIVTDETTGTVFNSTKQTIIVNPPLNSNLTVSNQIIDAGQPTVLTASIQGGTPPYKFTYSIYNSIYSVTAGTNNDVPATDPNNDMVPTNNSFTLNSIDTTVAPGVYTVNVVVVDNVLGTETLYNSITINSALKPTTLSINGASFSSGQNIVLSSNVPTTGTAPYSYDFEIFNPSTNSIAQSSGYQSSNTFSTSAGSSIKGTDNAIVLVKDNAGMIVQSSNTIEFNVSAPSSSSSGSGGSTGGSGGGGGGGGTGGSTGVSGGGGGGSSKPPAILESSTSEGLSTTVCYTVYNATTLKTLTINSTPIHIATVNYIQPESAGLTVNGTSVLLNLEQEYKLANTSNTVTTMDLLNDSYLPIEHTVTYDLCTTTTAKAPTTTAATTTTVKPTVAPTTTIQSTTTKSSSASGSGNTVAPSGTGRTPPPSSSNNLLVGAGLMILAIIVLALYFYSRTAMMGKSKRQKK